jgi:ribose/xylose/arabinose/galactoside ABC-type transport system permease subunit
MPNAPKLKSHRRWSMLGTSHRTELQLLVGVLILSAVYSILYPASFPTIDNLVEMSRVGGILFVAAIAQSFALIVGGFDISVAANMGFVSIVAALCMTDGGSVPLGVFLGLASGTGVGFANGFMIGRLGVTPFVATLGSLTFLYGLSNQLGNGGSIAGLPADLAWLGRRDWGVIPATVAIAFFACLLAWAILARSRAGLYIFSIGGSRETARVSGIPVVRYEILAYTLCGFFAAVAGIMLTSRVSIGQGSLGQGYELLSVATAVIGGVAIGGGVGRLSGVLLGVVLLTVLTTGLDIGGINQFFQQMVTGLVLIGAVLIARSRGENFASVRRVFFRSAIERVRVAQDDNLKSELSIGTNVPTQGKLTEGEVR